MSKAFYTVKHLTRVVLHNSAGRQVYEVGDGSQHISRIKLSQDEKTVLITYARDKDDPKEEYTKINLHRYDKIDFTWINVREPVDA